MELASSSFSTSLNIKYTILSTTKGNYDCSIVITVFFSALVVMFSLGIIAPQVKTIDEAKMAAYDIYEVIDSVAKVNKDNTIIPPEEFEGRIEFKNISFKYPTREDYILQGVKLWVYQEVIRALLFTY
jgi:ABC-type bacteriocin/lantibiotic exporter with double-glycine peptidase domain